MHRRVDQVRVTLGLNQLQFAESIGLSKAMVSQMLSGKRNISRETLNKISTLYNVNLEWLTTGNGSMFMSKQKSEQSLFDSSKPADQVENSSVNNLVNQLTNQSTDQDEKSYLIRQAEIIKLKTSDFESEPEKPVSDVDKIEQIKTVDDNGNEKIIPSTQIERVIIFFSDSTFTEHLPRK